VLLALATAVPAAEREAPLRAGERAPDVALADQHGRPFRLADALKQRDLVVLAFYVKAFTGG
jgi:peroxiredoxin